MPLGRSLLFSLRPRALRPLLALAGLGLAAACSSPRAAVWNLDGLMDEGNQLRHVVPLRDSWDQLAVDLIPGRADVDPEAVGDPSMRALEDLLVLASHEPTTLEGELEAVRVLARYAGACPGRLARERAALGLVPHALRIEVARPRRAPAQPTPPATVTSAFQRLKGAWAEGSDPADALAALRDLRLDLEAATRLLGAYAALLKSSGGGPALTEPLWEEGRRVQGVAIALALGAALDDRDPWVRAAAIEAGASIWGLPFVLETLESLQPARVDAEGRIIVTRAFGLAPIAAGEDLPIQRVLRTAGSRGPGLFDAMDADRRSSFRIGVLQLFLQISHDVASYADATRAAALQALTRLAPDGPGSRRKEEWETWWRDEADRVRRGAPLAPGANGADAKG